MSLLIVLTLILLFVQLLFHVFLLSYNIPRLAIFPFLIWMCWWMFWILILLEQIIILLVLFVLSLSKGICQLLPRIIYHRMLLIWYMWKCGDLLHSSCWLYLLSYHSGSLYTVHLALHVKKKFWCVDNSSSVLSIDSNSVWKKYQDFSGNTRELSFEDLFKEKGVVHQFSRATRPEQNFVIENSSRI